MNQPTLEKIASLRALLDAAEEDIQRARRWANEIEADERARVAKLHCSRES